MKCKICGVIDDKNSNYLCSNCSIAINTLNFLIKDLEDFLSSADSKRLPEYYSKNIQYFITNLSSYNKYVSVKNLIQEIVFMYNEYDDPIFRNDIENPESLKIEKIVNSLDKNGLISIEFNLSRNDYQIIPGDKISISKNVVDTFDLNSIGFSDYINCLFLFSMLVVVNEDILSWIKGDIKSFPRRGFFPIRLISGAIGRAINDANGEHYIIPYEILRSINGMSYRGKKKALTQILGMDFQTKSIFDDIPDVDEDTKATLTQNFSEIIDHFAERIRERKEDRDNIR